jgi:hypothetical protein
MSATAVAIRAAAATVVLKVINFAMLFLVGASKCPRYIVVLPRPKISGFGICAENPHIYPYSFSEERSVTIVSATTLRDRLAEFLDRVGDDRSRCMSPAVGGRLGGDHHEEE